MTVNETCVPGEGQCSRPVPESTSTVLIVSLMAVFLLVSIITGLIAYKLRNRFQFRLRRSQTKEEDGGEAIQVPCKPYRPTDLSREESAGPGETPIYENLATQPGRYNNCRVSQSRLPSEPEDGLYLQCDLPDDAIYSNDPACNPSLLTSSHEDDVYIVPDS